MKKLDDFKNERVELINIHGGGEVATADHYVNTNGCQVDVVDGFTDSNGNGEQDNGESSWLCKATTCESVAP
jgi:hypothetical protein